MEYDRSEFSSLRRRFARKRGARSCRDGLDGAAPAPWPHVNAYAIVLPALTLAAYIASLRLRAAHKAANTTPVFVSVILVVLVLGIARIPVATYFAVQAPITSLLLAACAALGVTTYKNRVVLRANAFAIGVALIAGSSVAIASAVVLARLVRLPPNMVDVVAIKSVTAPVALQLATIAHVDPAIVIAFVIATGMVGATLGPSLLSVARVRDPLARGFGSGEFGCDVHRCDRPFTRRWTHTGRDRPLASARAKQWPSFRRPTPGTIIFRRTHGSDHRFSP